MSNESREFGRVYPKAGLLIEAIARRNPAWLSTFKRRAPGDQFSVRIDSVNHPNGNYLEIFFDRVEGPMMIFSRWHKAAFESAGFNSVSDVNSAKELPAIEALLDDAESLMRDELVLVIHQDGMDFRRPSLALPELLARGDQVISWTGRFDFRKE